MRLASSSFICWNDRSLFLSVLLFVYLSPSVTFVENVQRRLRWCTPIALDKLSTTGWFAHPPPWGPPSASACAREKKERCEEDDHNKHHQWADPPKPGPMRVPPRPWPRVGFGLLGRKYGGAGQRKPTQRNKRFCYRSHSKVALCLCAPPVCSARCMSRLNVIGNRNFKVAFVVPIIFIP